MAHSSLSVNFMRERTRDGRDGPNICWWGYANGLEALFGGSGVCSSGKNVDRLFHTKFNLDRRKVTDIVAPSESANFDDWKQGAAEPRGPGGQLTPTFTRSTCGVWPPLFVSYSDFDPHFSLPSVA